MAPVSREQHGNGGIPRGKRALPAAVGGPSREERWAGANDEKAEKLLVRSLKRRAVAQGLQLRHSSYGYALIDAGRKPIKDRNDLTLAEIKVLLDPAAQG